jgi:hypothetical protein
VGSNWGWAKMTGGPKFGPPHAWAPGALSSAPFDALTVVEGRDGFPQARGSYNTSRAGSVADLTCRLTAPAGSTHFAAATRPHRRLPISTLEAYEARGPHRTCRARPASSG